MYFILTLTLILCNLSFGNTCKRLIDCINESSKLSGIKYIYPEGTLNTKHELNVEMILDKSNAQTVLSEALSVFDFVRVPTKIDKVWKIIPAKDIHQQADLPTFKSSKKQTPQLPKNQDPISLMYQTQKTTNVTSLANSLKPFVTEHGRILTSQKSMIIIIDRASSVSKILPILQASDGPVENKQHEHDHENEKHLIEEFDVPAPGMEEQFKKKGQ